MLKANGFFCEEIKCEPIKEAKVYFDVVRWKMPEAWIDDEGVLHQAGGDPVPYVDKGVNINDFIQASEPLCDLRAIYARSCQLNDPSLLNVNPGSYGDFSDIPTNIHEADQMSLNQLAKFEESYDKLPDNIKEVFGSKAEFINAVLGDRFDEYITKLNNLNNEVVNNAE